MQKLLRYRDLKALGLVNSRPSLANLQRDQGFPIGRRLGVNTRVWTQAEVDAWFDARPTEPKLRPGRRKDALSKAIGFSDFPPAE